MFLRKLDPRLEQEARERHWDANGTVEHAEYIQHDTRIENRIDRKSLTEPFADHTGDFAEPVLLVVLQ